MKENCQGQKLAGNNCRVKKALAGGLKKIGATGFEPATSWSQTKRSTKLSYAPGRRTLVRRFLLGKKRLAIHTSFP